MSTDLVIILSTDWVGSTRTRAELGEDTADAVQEVHDTLLRRVIGAEGGKVVKHYGDGVLATFNSATAALGAAVKIQQDFAAYRASPDAMTRMDVRVGLSAGDIKHQSGDIFGLPVVEAVRLQSSAAPNETLCSDLVRVLSQGRGGFEFEDAGIMELKGLPAQVHAHKVRRPETTRADLSAAVQRAPHSESASPTARPERKPRTALYVAAAGLLAVAVVLLLVDRFRGVAPPIVTARVATAETAAVVRVVPAGRPRIAVLPFDNLSPDPDHAFFADGLHDEILSALANAAAGLDVVSRTTMMLYRAAPKPLRTIAEELDATHVLEGSVRRDGERMRLTLKLIDGSTDNDLWAESFEGTVTESLMLQAEVAAAVAAQLAVEITGSTASGATTTVSPAAYELYLKARLALRNLNGAMPSSAWYEVGSLLTQSITIDPTYARAHLQRLYVHAGLFAYSYDASRQRLDLARQDLEALRKLSPADPVILAGEAVLHFVAGDYPQALEAFATAERAGVSDPDALIWKAWLLMQSGQYEASTALFARLVELDPGNPYLSGLAWFNFMESRKATDAVRMLNVAQSLSPAEGLWRVLRAQTVFSYTGDLAALAEITEPDQILLLVERASVLGPTGEYDYGDMVTNAVRRLLNQGRLSEANIVLEAVPAAAIRAPLLDDTHFSIGVGLTPVADLRGWMSLVLRDAEGAAANGRRVLDFTAQATETPRNRWYLTALKADAAVFQGRNAEAIAGALSIIEQTSGSADLATLATGKFLAARVLAWTGREDASVEYLEDLSVAVPGLAPGNIAHAPVFTLPLAENARFRALRARLEAQMAAARLE